MDDDFEECPLCMEEIDLTDRYFKPCTCGYQICRFCWHHIKENLNGLCPACRRPYSEQTVEFKPITPEELTRIKNEKKQKEREKKEQELSQRKHLANMRVVQKNLVYVIGLPPRLANEEILRQNDFFGQYGKIHKVVVNRRGSPGIGVYITYTRKEDAAKAIAAVDGSVCDGRVIRASYGTTKYCAYYLRGQSCQNPNCMYLHEPGDEADSYTKEELIGRNVHAASTHHQNQLQHQNRPQGLATLSVERKNSSSSLGASSTSENDGSALPPTASWARPGVKQTNTRASSSSSLGPSDSPIQSPATGAPTPAEAKAMADAHNQRHGLVSSVPASSPPGLASSPTLLEETSLQPPPGLMNHASNKIVQQSQKNQQFLESQKTQQLPQSTQATRRRRRGEEVCEQTAEEVMGSSAIDNSTTTETISPIRGIQRAVLFGFCLDPRYNGPFNPFHDEPSFSVIDGSTRARASEGGMTSAQSNSALYVDEQSSKFEKFFVEPAAQQSDVEISGMRNTPQMTLPHPQMSQQLVQQHRSVPPGVAAAINRNVGTNANILGQLLRDAQPRSHNRLPTSLHLANSSVPFQDPAIMSLRLGPGTEQSSSTEYVKTDAQKTSRHSSLHEVDFRYKSGCFLNEMTPLLDESSWSKDYKLQQHSKPSAQKLRPKDDNSSIEQARDQPQEHTSEHNVALFGPSTTNKSSGANFVQPNASSATSTPCLTRSCEVLSHHTNSTISLSSPTKSFSSSTFKEEVACESVYQKRNSHAASPKGTCNSENKNETGLIDASANNKTILSNVSFPKSLTTSNKDCPNKCTATKGGKTKNSGMVTSGKVNASKETTSKDHALDKPISHENSSSNSFSSNINSKRIGVAMKRDEVGTLPRAVKEHTDFQSDILRFERALSSACSSIIVLQESLMLFDAVNESDVMKDDSRKFTEESANVVIDQTLESLLKTSQALYKGLEAQIQRIRKIEQSASDSARADATMLDDLKKFEKELSSNPITEMFGVSLNPSTLTWSSKDWEIKLENVKLVLAKVNDALSLRHKQKDAASAAAAVAAASFGDVSSLSPPSSSGASTTSSKQSSSTSRKLPQYFTNLAELQRLQTFVRTLQQRADACRKVQVVMPNRGGERHAALARNVERLTDAVHKSREDEAVLLSRLNRHRSSRRKD